MNIRRRGTAIIRKRTRDGLEQYHKLEWDLAGAKNVNCMVCARRHFANAIKGIEKGNHKVVQSLVAYKAIVRIGVIYDLEGALRI